MRARKLLYLFIIILGLNSSLSCASPLKGNNPVPPSDNRLMPTGFSAYRPGTGTVWRNRQSAGVRSSPTSLPVPRGGWHRLSSLEYQRLALERQP